MCDSLSKRIVYMILFLWLTDSMMITLASGHGKNHHTTDEVRYIYKTEKYEMAKTTSPVRVIEEKVLIKKRISNISEKSYEVLCRIVQAEAGGEDKTGKQLVADVIINRVNHPKFPNTIEEVVFQQDGGKTQFSPISDGRYYSVKISEETREAVNDALLGEDSSQGALYFVNPIKADAGNYSWFERSLSFCKEHGGHRFYK